MKLAVISLTVLAVIGLLAGIILIIFEKIAFAGVVWAVTALVSCIAFRLAKYGKEDK